jgi:hypothetical protein
MPQEWIVEHSDADGVIDLFRYDHYGTAKDVADQTWEQHKDQPGHVVKLYHKPNPSAPAALIYAPGETLT